MGEYKGTKLRAQIAVTNELLHKALGLAEDLEIINASWDSEREVLHVYLTSQYPLVLDTKLVTQPIHEAAFIPIQALDEKSLNKIMSVDIVEE